SFGAARRNPRPGGDKTSPGGAGPDPRPARAPPRNRARLPRAAEPGGCGRCAEGRRHGGSLPAAGSLPSPPQESRRAYREVKLWQMNSSHCLAQIK
ncbi:hypothetical protein DV515_00001911, partial [Chloebia gouldiae]